MKIPKILLAIIIIEILILTDILPIFSQKFRKPIRQNPIAQIEPIKTSPEQLEDITDKITTGNKKIIIKETEIEPLDYQEFFSDKTTTAKIGYTGIIRHDNPVDNVFHVNIDRLIDPGSEVWLEYELQGVSGQADVCRSINDNTSFGGYFIRKNNNWQQQKEKISPSNLKQGSNVIRFTSFPDSKYGYRIKNLKVKVNNPTNEHPREIVINQGEEKAYFDNKAYLKGFISGQGSENAIIKFQGHSVRMQGNEFEVVVDKPLKSRKVWTVDIVVEFLDGEVIKHEVEFAKSVKADIINDFKADLLFTENFVNTEESFKLEIPGAGITADQASVINSTKLSITGLRSNDVLPVSSGMVNVTGKANAYRCLPHGMHFEKEIALSLGINMDKLPKGYRIEDVFTYYFDELLRKWIRLERDSIDLKNNLIISKTNHFTDFINGIIKVPESPQVNAFTPNSIKDLQVANPLDGIPLVQPPTANNMGTANLSFPFKIPAGRHGMQPNLSASYSSNNSNGWLGLGWSLNIPAITVETRWGVPYYNSVFESETYMLNGEQLTTKDDSGFYQPLPHRKEWEYRIVHQQRFYPRVEGAFNRIIRYGDNPQEYYWEVTTTDGTRYYYGKSFSTDSYDTASVLMDEDGNIAHWALSEVIDMNGNFVRYIYQRIEESGLSGGSEKGQQLYIKTIKYTGYNNQDGKCRIEFQLPGSGWTHRKDAIISGRKGYKEVTDHLLDRIVMWSNDTMVRSYFMGYDSGAYNKTLLCGITEVAPDQYNDVSESGTGENIYNRCAFSVELGILPYTFDYFEPPGNPNGLFSSSYTTILESGATTMASYNLCFAQSEDPTALGGSGTKSNNWGGALTVGFGFASWLKTLSVGGNYNKNTDESIGLLSLIDLNGDGFPDKVYKQESNDSIYYRPLKYNNGSYYFGSSQKLIGINRFLRSVYGSRSWGLEAQASFTIGGSPELGASASAEWGKSESSTGTYFSDVDADGLPDIIDNSYVYFNKLVNGVPTFSEVTNDSVWVGDNTCGGIVLTSGSVDDSLFLGYYLEGSELISKETKQKDNDMDAVRIWIAPYDGTINIYDTVTLTPDYEERRLGEYVMDGAKYSVQQNNNHITSDTIGPYGDTIIVSVTSNSVIKGDHLYFRLESKKRRLFDKVTSNPVITYTALSNPVDSTITDADGKYVYKFRASEGFVLNDRQMIKFPIDGVIKVNN